jgi:hypothetical protein
MISETRQLLPTSIVATRLSSNDPMFLGNASAFLKKRSWLLDILAQQLDEQHTARMVKPAMRDR